MKWTRLRHRLRRASPASLSATPGQAGLRRQKKLLVEQIEPEGVVFEEPEAAGDPAAGDFFGDDGEAVGSVRLLGLELVVGEFVAERDGAKVFDGKRFGGELFRPERGEFGERGELKSEDIVDRITKGEDSRPGESGCGQRDFLDAPTRFAQLTLQGLSAAWASARGEERREGFVDLAEVIASVEGNGLMKRRLDAER